MYLKNKNLLKHYCVLNLKHMYVLYKDIQIVSLFLYIKTLGEKTIQTVIIISSHCRVTEGFKELYKNKFSIVNAYDFF